MVNTSHHRPALPRTTHLADGTGQVTSTGHQPDAHLQVAKAWKNRRAQRFARRSEVRINESWYRQEIGAESGIKKRGPDHGSPARQPDIRPPHVLQRVGMRLAHRLAPSEIAQGYILMTKMDGARGFFNQFEVFDAETEWGPLYARTVGSRNIWLGHDFMRHFNPGDYMVFEKTGPAEVRITRRVHGS